MGLAKKFFRLLLFLILPAAAVWYNALLVFPVGPASPPKVIKTKKQVGVDEPISLLFLGDTMLGDKAKRLLRKKGYHHPLKKTAQLVVAADLAIINAEAPISDKGRKIDLYKKWEYRSDPKALDALLQSGVDLFALANNHIFDYGPEAAYDFIERISRGGAEYIGVGAKESEARRGRVFDFGGVRVGILNYMRRYRNQVWYYDTVASGEKPGVAGLSVRALKSDIEMMKGFADIIVVYPHWGQNYQPVDDNQRYFGRRAIELGADAVIGHHPHILQEVELYRGKPIVYSLGNYVFNTTGKDTFRYGMGVQVKVARRRIDQLQFIPLITQNREIKFQPKPATGKDADQFFTDFISASAARGATIDRLGDHGVLQLP